MSEDLQDILSNLGDITKNDKSDDLYESMMKTPEKGVDFSNMKIDGDVLSRMKKSLDEKRIKITDDIPRPTQVVKLGGATIATLGDITTLTGKAKSRKSYFLSAVITEALHPGYYGGNLEVILPPERKNIVWIDTEQSRFWSQNILYRVFGTGVSKEEIDNRIYYYNCRSLSPEEMKVFLYVAIEKHHLSSSICILDGSRDLISSVNDDDDSAQLAKWILELGEKYNINITNVLHQNPSSSDGSKLRGHLGTELMNKSEFVVETKQHPQDKNLHMVSTMLSRDVATSEFCFEVIDGIFEFADSPEEVKSEKSRFLYNMLIDDLKKMTRELFKLHPSLSQSKLKTAMKEYLIQNHDHDVGVQKIVDEWIPHMENKGLLSLIDEGGSGKAKIYEKSDFADTPTGSDEDDIPF